MKTIFLCVPNECARTLDDVEEFARRSGWVNQVEADADLLIAPVAPAGWEAEPRDLVRDLYLEHRNDFQAPSGKTVPGRNGVVWTWEPLIHLVGYAEGATYVGNLTVAHPAFAATTTMVDGAPSDYSAADDDSDHWFVPTPKASVAKNHEVPVAVQLLGTAADDDQALAYFRASGAPEWAIHTDKALSGVEPRVAEITMLEFMEHVIRWKNSPDGTLAWHISKHDFFEGSAYRHFSVNAGGINYHFAAYVPNGVCQKPALLLSIHGRGEPSWIFCEKNGWERLADEDKGFVVILPDSPGNIWSQTRDDASIAAIVAKAIDELGCDPERVYVTGFSNGAAFTAQQATTHPELFAAASPWNCPPSSAIKGSAMGDFVCNPAFATAGYEMPFWTAAGDADNKAPAHLGVDVDVLLKGNGCTREGADTVVDGRIATTRFRNAAGSVRVCETLMQDMPHGAISAEARACWEFMKHFRRPTGAKNVIEE
ncbi:MAG: alpha/beta hydrolase family esterase [Atopobiaceae bacterium]